MADAGKEKLVSSKDDTCRLIMDLECWVFCPRFWVFPVQLAIRELNLAIPCRSPANC